MPLRPKVVAGLVAALLLAGCSTASPVGSPATTTNANAPATSSAPGSPGPGGVTPVWGRADLIPVSRVKAANGVAVVMTRNEAALSVTAVDPVSGTTLWSRPATPSAVVPGISVDFTVLAGRHVAWLEPGSLPGFARLVVVDPRGSGRVVARSDEFRFLSYPRSCEDDTYVCADAESDSLAATFRFRPGMKRLEQVTHIKATHLESIGPDGLVRYIPLGGRGNRIGVVRGADLLWSRSEADLFGTDYTTGGGWTFEHDPASDTFIGSVGPDVELGDQLPLGKSVLSVAIRRSSGTVVWRRSGIDLFCDRDFTGRPGDPLVACRWTAGTATVETPKPPVKDAAYALERIDPRTGRTRWSADVGKPSMTTWERPDIGVGRGFAVAATGGAATAVRLDDGSVRAATPADRTWRDKDLTFEGDVPFRSHYQTVFERHGTVDEQLVAGAVSTAVGTPLPDSVGVRLDGVAVLALEGRLVGLPVRR